jgi:hypothetical protein
MLSDHLNQFRKQKQLESVLCKTTRNDDKRKHELMQTTLKIILKSIFSTSWIVTTVFAEITTFGSVTYVCC